MYICGNDREYSLSRTIGSGPEKSRASDSLTDSGPGLGLRAPVGEPRPDESRDAEAGTGEDERDVEAEVVGDDARDDRANQGGDPDDGTVDAERRPVVVPPNRVEDHRVRGRVVYPVREPARDREEDQCRDEEPVPGDQDGGDPEGRIAGPPQDKALDGNLGQRPVRYVTPGEPERDD